MSNQSLPGNPFVGEPDGDGVIDAVVFSADDSPMQTTELLLDNLKNATLALAFEQRTANLIALTGMKLQVLAQGADFRGELAEELNSRLGWGGAVS